MRSVSYTLMPLFLACLVAAQAPTKKPPEPEAAEQAKQLPPFPKERAKWVIRGKVRADRLVTGRETLTMNVLDLTLPAVTIQVRGPRRWSCQAEVLVSIDEEGRLSPASLTVACGQSVRIASRLREWITLEVAGDLTCGMRTSFLRSACVLHVNDVGRGHGEEGRQGMLRYLVATKPGARITISNATRPSSTVIWVRPHPLSCITDKEGRFVMPALPDGTYELVAVHRLLGEASQTVAIAGSDPKPVTFVFKVPDELKASQK